MIKLNLWWIYKSDIYINITSFTKNSHHKEGLHLYINKNCNIFNIQCSIVFIQSNMKKNYENHDLFDKIIHFSCRKDPNVMCFQKASTHWKLNGKSAMLPGITIDWKFEDRPTKNHDCLLYTVGQISIRDVMKKKKKRFWDIHIMY